MWDQRYSSDHYVYGTAPNDFLKAQFEQIPAGGQVLCLAEGEGRNAVFLAEQGYKVTAIDLSEVGLNKALKLACDKGVAIITHVSDLADYSLGEAQWDGIVSISAHMPPAVRQRIHAQVAPALRPGGVMILEAYTEQQLEMQGVGGPPASQKDKFMSLETLRAELGELEEVVGVELQREMSEGELHHGPSAVVQYIGRKR